mmetsp:Transcript_23045/g.37917  ORF Transcript_23045/g.37917 Transcript_23045/m.37917 type:complete len:183 (-) Transcript_23045:248-796(-)|eukprot:CAMPEP_0184664022 /NCGR_PEP_ID=MMETSP0308-20130426/50859_1 /TAXON_ID=38269 /ORGANISM="Gloeochaete witrockiana, Strain SAG 46.84" /LENGTH=182 /DNA_ID=CAMNT_0027107153 /DNA_START=171 /DNA_END=719 /DNA_ORIENTATION=-
MERIKEVFTGHHSKAESPELRTTGLTHVEKQKVTTETSVVIPEGLKQSAERVEEIGEQKADLARRLAEDAAREQELASKFKQLENTLQVITRERDEALTYASTLETSNTNIWDQLLRLMERHRADVNREVLNRISELQKDVNQILADEETRVLELRKSYTQVTRPALLDEAFVRVSTSRRDF